MLRLRLEKIFKILNYCDSHLIIARPNYRCCTSCSCYELSYELEYISEDLKTDWLAGLYWHNQDDELLDDNDRLEIYLGHIIKPGMEEIFLNFIKPIFNKYGLNIEWDGNVDTKILVKLQNWNQNNKLSK